ncbi:MAG TPA: DUF397 domain-containing protein [Micromonosporaceae bacterium]
MINSDWTKSKRSDSGGNCVEVRRADHDIQVRDSKNPTGSVLTFTPAEWTAFIDAAKDGQFSL